MGTQIHFIESETVEPGNCRHWFQVSGWEAIELAESQGLQLDKSADPTEKQREAVSIADARAIAQDDPNLIHVTIGVWGGQLIEPSGGESVTASPTLTRLLHAASALCA